MSRKKYKHGDRVNFYISKKTPDKLLDFINNQSDLTIFVLLAIQELYKETGNVDLSNYIPRNFTFNLDEPSNDIPKNTLIQKQPLIQKPIEEEYESPSNRVPIMVGNSNRVHEESNNDDSWSDLDSLGDDPYA